MSNQRTGPGSTRARFLFGALVVAGALGCGSPSPDPPRGEANGSFETEVFLPGSNPPNYGDGAIEMTVDGGTPFWLAQGASAVAIDADGHPTIDPDQATFFAVQVFQYTSDDTIEVFELRVDPSEWSAGNEVPVNTVEADALFGRVFLDANGQQIGGEVLLGAIRGDLVLEDAGLVPGDPVRGTLTAIEMIAP